jgi:HAD superfamily hydrolase (TIGR01509 family)
MIEAVLWDCDGCLIDSEYIACSHGARLLTEAGYPISADDYIRRFCGQGESLMYGTIESEIGFDIRTKLDKAKKKREREQLFRTQLKAIDGIPELLKKIDLPMAVASGSDPDRLQLTLSIVGLYDQLMPHVYSADLVSNGKPAPDIFLYAANQLGIVPEHCLVIEDSENGVRAGRAAGMPVIGFTGGAHILDKAAHAMRLTELGADHVAHDTQGIGRHISALAARR